MAPDKLVSIKEAILQALEMMGKDDMRALPVLNIWAVQAEDKIGSYYGLEKKIEVIDINGCIGTLSCGTRKVLGLLLGDHGTDCDLLFDRICSLNLNSIDYTSLDTGVGITIIGGNREIKSVARYEHRSNGIIEFPYKPNTNKATVKVLKHHVDADGFIQVQYCHVLAIAAYIKWRISEQSRFGPDKMTFQDITYFQNEWFVACRDAIAQSAQVSENEQQEISALVNNPLSGNVFHISR
jgi:hypothetical protein